MLMPGAVTLSTAVYLQTISKRQKPLLVLLLIMGAWVMLI
ncbi:hypothetical protein SAMN05216285_1523 [Natrinema salifodinae]|uniref:Uncharacterized protein n=1 Tax=Natrinema salifodinae TaxID=1202768 RepID=A0A1I0NBF5_9EURY|nr:hypothetical protein SAMN05216285_1523 [Natrinema salifodinae]